MVSSLLLMLLVIFCIILFLAFDFQESEQFNLGNQCSFIMLELRF